MRAIEEKLAQSPPGCPDLPNPESRRRQRRGTLSQLSGQAAEASVERHYLDLGWRILARRWRGQAGEIDLVLARGGLVAAVEVKCSRSHAAALERVTTRQLDRVSAALCEFLERRSFPPDTDLRVDIGLVDGFGAVSVIENVTQG